MMAFTLIRETTFAFLPRKNEKKMVFFAESNRRCLISTGYQSLIRLLFFLQIYGNVRSRQQLLTHPPNYDHTNNAIYSFVLILK